jgi:hypothetical protein
MQCNPTIPPRFRLCATLLLGLLIGTLPMRAQGAERTATIKELQQQLDESLKAIQALTERVRELESRQPGAAVASAPPTPDTPPVPAVAPAAATAASSPTEAARLEALEQQLDQLESSNAGRGSADTGLPLHGFADVGVATHNPINAALKGFNVGNLDFYLTPRLSDRSRALFEMNTEVGSEGQVGVDLERAQIGYQFADQATVWLGRFHTPFGYVNTAFHHGAWVNDSLRRPGFLNFEDSGGIVPAHTVGLWITGTPRVGQGKVQYDAYVGNGQQIQGGIIDMRSAGNAHGNLIFGGRLAYLFNSGATEGLTLGVHAFDARIDDDALPRHLTRVASYGGYAVYDTDQWENIAEVYLFDDEDLSGSSGTHRSHAGFVQLGYRASWGVPYARYESTSLDQTDNFFAAQNAGASYHRSALGLRYDLGPDAAVKLEFADTQLTDRSRDHYDAGLIQYAIRF